ncbi:hypothetical protein BD410DRAFT_714561 [Rickenella mellea]|uniref:G-patch domain-containing protein n=1 Tax=Rickenella mellea TaxID=50990 RepID=A0A4Y7QIX5_9AGAM|nr:hypothetical protein BD410DRAFT_714561 [Rickenella mellea]
MSHAGREWDQGKDWSESGYRANVRGREGDDQYGEGKRRKYNNGGYDDGQWSSYSEGNSSQYSHGHGHHDFSFDDQSYDDRHHRGQNRKRHIASEPSPHVIFLGLDTDFTEADLFNFLKGHGCVLETATIIRDRITGTCPFTSSACTYLTNPLLDCFGFAQFKSTEHARVFVDPNFPFISVPPPASHGASATIAYRKALETGASHNGRRVKIDYSQSANPPDKGRGRGPQFTNDGTRDIGNAQAPVLLFRGLDPLSGPAAVAQAMMGSQGLGTEGAKGMRRILLIKDKVTMASWGFAFVEFIDIQSAAAVLAATMSHQLHPNGFCISDRPVAASFAHPYSFQPLPDHALQDETCVAGSVNLGGVDGGWIKYWDDGASLATMEFKVEEPVLQVTPTSAKEKEKKKKPKGPSVDEQPFAPAEASALPVSTKPVMLNFSSKTGQQTAKASVPVTYKAALGFLAVDDPNAPNNEDESGNVIPTIDKDTDKTVPRVAPLIASKKVVSNITKWSQIQEELKQTVTHVNEAAARNTQCFRFSLSTIVMQAPVDTAVAVEDEFEFSDQKAMTCLLCSRQFKTLDVLKRHNKESDLHKARFSLKNLKDGSQLEIARNKANATRQKKPTPDNANKYRDRASERRTLFNQPEVPMGDGSKGTTNKRVSEGPPPPPSPPPAPVAPAKDEKNVGNKLLKMMGWTEGSGLGTSGEGRVEPIQTAIYATGVGLGASKGKEVGKYAEGYAGYVHMAKDMARERYGD